MQSFATVSIGGGKSERLLWLWFKSEFAVLQAQGLVDTKVKLFVDQKTTSTGGVVLTLAHVYRMRRLGLCKPVVVD